MSQILENTNQPTPKIEGKLRKGLLRLPEVIRGCSGIEIFGRIIRSLVFTTDLAMIRNCNADAILGVYPFTPQPIINQALLSCAEIPVFAGVGGGLTTGTRAVNLAIFSELQGATGVVVNAPTDPDTIRRMAVRLEIPIVVTVPKWSDRIEKQLEAGAGILNVAAAGSTPELVRKVREQFPEVPVMASGGPTNESITATIAAGAHAITWTPPSSKELFSKYMTQYREEA